MKGKFLKLTADSRIEICKVYCTSFIKRSPVFSFMYFVYILNVLAALMCKLLPAFKYPSEMLYFPKEHFNHLCTS